MRRFWVIVFCAIGLTGLVASTVATTALLTALNKAKVVTIADRALKRPSVQERLVDQISVEVLKQMPAAGRTEAATLAIRTAAKDAINDPAFEPLWQAAAGGVYDTVLAGRRTPVTLDNAQVTALVRSQLAAINPSLVVLLPPATDLTVQVTTASLPNLQPAVRIVRLGPYIGAGVALVGYGLALVISRRPRKTLRGSGWWIQAAGVILLAGALAGPRYGLPLVRPNRDDLVYAITSFGWRTWVPAAALLGLGTIVAILGAILTLRAPENRITRVATSVPDAVEGQPPVEAWDCRV